MSLPRALVDKLAGARRGAGRADRPPSRSAGPLTFARALFDDLVDKNLWPVALMLCAAIVAIPVLMTRDAGSGRDAGVPAAPPQGDAGVTNAFEPIGPATVRTRSGKQLDPFRQPAKKETETTAAAGSMPLGAGLSSGASPSAGSPSAGSPSAAPPSAAPPSAAPPSGGTPSSDTPPATTKPAVNPATLYYRTEVRWSETEGGEARTISRLTPLGDDAARAALYLGVSASGYALFLLSPDARAEGAGGCEDRPGCRGFALKAGEKQLITVRPSGGGTARRYHLEVVSVQAVATSVAVARTKRAKVHADGRAVMRAMWADAATAQALSTVRYDEPTGVVVLTTAVKKTTK